MLETCIMIFIHNLMLRRASGMILTSDPKVISILHLKCDGTRAETRFHLSPKRTSPFKSAGASVQSTAGSRGGRISSSNAGYTMFRGSVKGTGYPLHSPVSPPVRNRVPSLFSWTLHSYWLWLTYECDRCVSDCGPNRQQPKKCWYLFLNVANMYGRHGP
jgi:hypothetical protein